MRKSRSLSGIVSAVGILCAVSAFPLIAGCSGEQTPRMSKETLKGKLNDPGLIVVDVRTESAWEKCDTKITGARRESPEKVSAWMANYPKEKTIVFYCSCSNDATSKRVAKQLRDGGFENVYALSGGWKEWIEADFPTEQQS
jgi:rhodanese-related sulfurtransferase